MMITLKHAHYKIHDEVSNNDKVHYSFMKFIIQIIQELTKKCVTKKDVQINLLDGYGNPSNGNNSLQ